ncbi:PTS transporter subunit IIC [Anaerosalibacter massiliensis]|uniref:PTS galactitol transporter subunit IIC n=1 Tax=Anaerosalibacter massiliensis TaxID=1347392 RepID=A0A9X2ML04_9FIRM|nr:PTS transporter subunit IIC [Anaerosalibacter massiliensis]MCR2045654.1 PTS galactitol transporter subunit IIC [Anaerosalibacter massiliensis]
MVNIIQSILKLGPAIMLPIMILLLGLFFKMKFGKALKAGLFVGIGFQGLSLVIDLLMRSISPATKYYEAMGSGFTTVDVGFAAIGGASWGVAFAPIAVFIIFAINVILLRLKVVNVMNVDIWNFIHFLIPGAMAYALFDSAVLGLAITVLLSVITLFVSQKIAPKWQEYFGLEGTTCSTFSYITLIYPVSYVINKIIDAIPGLNKVDISMDKMAEKLGFLGDPAVIGLIIGVFLGALTKQPWTTCLTIGMGISAVLILIPRMVSIMMEGLSIIGNSAQEYMREKIGDDAELNIGMDIALGLGDPTVVTVTVLCLPIVILFAFLIPNMSYFPVGLLGGVCYVIPMCAMASKGNVLRTFITSAVSLFFIVLLSNYFAPEATAMMKITGVEVSGMVTDGFFGYNIGNIIVGLLSKLIN